MRKQESRGGSLESGGTGGGGGQEGEGHKYSRSWGQAESGSHTLSSWEVLAGSAASVS